MFCNCTGRAVGFREHYTLQIVPASCEYGRGMMLTTLAIVFVLWLLLMAIVVTLFNLRKPR